MADLDLSHPRFRRQFSFVLYDKIAHEFEDLLQKCRPNKKTDLIAACIRHALAEITGKPDSQNERDIERLKKHYQSAAESRATEPDIAAIEEKIRNEMREELESAVNTSVQKTLAEFLLKTPASQFKEMQDKLAEKRDESD
tara:strand:- start:144 stop:566 length:423 start_codon:yes stop_codon:yes gene_type:complete